MRIPVGLMKTHNPVRQFTVISLILEASKMYIFTTMSDWHDKGCYCTEGALTHVAPSTLIVTMENMF